MVRTNPTDRFLDSTRGKHLVLIPGDSPIGLRLPVSSLPWVAVTEYPFLQAQCAPHQEIIDDTHRISRS